MRSSPPLFSVWLRRVDPPEGPFVVRYEVRDGKGAVRMAHAGVIIDPPLRARGDEPGLSATDLRAARFLHAPSRGARGVYSLGRLEPAILAALPKGEWVALEIGSDGGAGCLVVPRAGAAVEAGELDLPTIPFRVLSDLEAGLESPVEPTRPSAARPVRESEPTERTGPTEHGDELELVPLVEVAPEEPPRAAEPAPSDWPGLALHHRSTTAIRHLRRVVLDLELRNRVLEARLTRARTDEP